jgi:hypothetical protein
MWSYPYIRDRDPPSTITRCDGSRQSTNLTAPAHIPGLDSTDWASAQQNIAQTTRCTLIFPFATSSTGQPAGRSERGGVAAAARGRLVVRRCWTAGLPVAWPCACGLRPLRRARRRCSPQLPMLAAGGETWNWVRSGPQGHGTAASAPAHGAVAVESRPSGVWLFDAHCHLQDPRIVKKMSGTPLGSLPAN